MCLKQGMELFQKHLQAVRKGQGYIPLTRGRMGTPGCVNRRVGGKIVCGRFWNLCAYDQKERPPKLETMRISKNPATVMTSNGEVQTTEATVYVKVARIRDSYASGRNTRSSFTREAL